VIPIWLSSMTSARLRLTLNWSGAVLLTVGLGTAVLIWNAQDRIDRENEAAQIADPQAPLSSLDSRRHMRDLELYSGKVGVLMEEARELLHGKPLARTIAVASVLTATGLFLIASRSPD
jgi:hypothetical protein